MSGSYIVVDVGNSALHFGLFDSISKYSVPQQVLHLPYQDLDFQIVAEWLPQQDKNFHWRIGSVNPAIHGQLKEWIESRSENARFIELSNLPIKVAIKNSHTVGIDRVAAAVAANHLRQSNPAIVIDAGTAITIDCVSAEGIFLGGAIAPGFELSIKALNKNTAQLPLTNVESIPNLIGDSTIPAIHSGVYWMTVGGIDSLIDRMRQELASPCSIYATGGSMPTIMPNLRAPIEHYPQLVLSGLAMAQHD